MSSDVSTYVLLSHAQALRRQMDIAASNMANVNTPGYKRGQALFHSFVERTREAPIPDARSTSFVLDFGAVHDARAGAFQATGNPLDVMIEGPGYLAVRDAAGATAYTRDGMLHVRPDGLLAAAGGQPVLDEGGRPITIPPERRAGLAIAADGTITAASGAGSDTGSPVAGAPIARLGVTVFDELRVSERGDGLLSGAGGRLLAPAETHLRTGGAEASNVQPILESTHMIEILRAYQTSMEMSANLDALRKQAIGRLGKAE
ncbi:flagellar hook-basal body complex protein [Sphingomonas morindae]|uniref:Flagellar basal-body rod protein FlgF n=1 Tax=Sphingomonas morindae TaxID=1541170 RepID=A0ABY4X507_9SPHN|nr:flagellar hook-basal body complex protein [Sphingomonas morindae]USI71982.1 flagellar hook-basal body complex protein [Sphingomonas morindae]